MNKKIFILLMLFLIPNSIKAYCTNQDITRYNKLSSNINSYYEYDEVNNKFNITFYNVQKELFVRNTNTHEQYNNSSSDINEIKIYGINPGTQLSYGIYPISGECTDYRIRTIYINVPSYNIYYQDPVCQNNNHQLCSKWANTSMYSYEQFVNKVKIENKKEEVEEKKPEKEEKKYGFFDFLADYYILMLLTIIVTGSYTIYKLDKKNKFDF